ncbi:MAG TPA: fatty acid desaturase [Polyangiales bacterium]|jgi:omega-6 fatty acid desaturase (delta-12 desaturase)|nr:fatty acid desaturase [Polyangiales bacterium]
MMTTDRHAARSDQEIIKASNVYAQENVRVSWFHLITTLGGLLSSQIAAALIHVWWMRLGFSVVAGLMTVRAFIIYHDFKHGSILRNSRAAKWILNPFGLYVLTPSKVWTQTHNYHHAHTAKLVGSHVGSYMMLSTSLWETLTPSQRFMYRLVRHPFTILFGYVTVFLYGFCAAAFTRNPRKNTDSLIAIVAQMTMIFAIWKLFGMSVLVYSLLLPQLIAHALGAYLFYAQHNFPEAYVQPRESWTFVRASLESSSYMKLGPVMRYFTGNIGFHHVHHLNHRIPFYRLPEAMAGIPELREPHGVTSLHPRDIAACFRLKLWDPELGRLVPFPDPDAADSDIAAAI